MEKEENPCKSCGLCCIYYPTEGIKKQWAQIENHEIKNVPRKLYSITKKEIIHPQNREMGFNKFIKDKPDKVWKGFKRCVALDGVQCQSVSCTVYENRPRVCSDFQPGSFMCDTIRKWGGLDVL